MTADLDLTRLNNDKLIDSFQLFFWFFEARNADPEMTPLTVYIQRGPGLSSIIGLFQECRACGVDINEDVCVV